MKISDLRLDYVIFETGNRPNFLLQMKKVDLVWYDQQPIWWPVILLFEINTAVYLTQMSQCTDFMTL